MQAQPGFHALQPARVGAPRSCAASILLLALAACAASAPPATPAQVPAPRTLEEYAAQIGQAGELLDHEEFARADVLLTSIITSHGFASLPAELRHATLQAAAAAALELGSPKRALTLLRRSSGMEQADANDGFLSVMAGEAADETKEVATALTLVAVHWPQALPQLEPNRVLGRAMLSLDEVGSVTDRFAVLTALFNAPLKEEHDDDSDWWQDLALMRLQRNDLDGARKSLLRIKDAYVAISVEADKRYDPIRDHLDAWPGVVSIAGRTIDTVAKRAQDNPGELEYMDRLADLLAQSQRFEQELQVADTAIEAVEADGPKAYPDYDDWYLWILNARAYALFGLGRWDAAIAQEQAASEVAEDRGPNVSAVINLADMYARSGKPQECLATLKRLQSGTTSAFGSMESQRARVLAAVQLHDDAVVKEGLAFMRQHREESMGALEEALLAAGHDDEAAQLLISRLDDAERRTQALLAVQQYDEGVAPPFQIELRRRWKALVDRSDVQAAIARVGRVGHYPVDRSSF